MNSRSIWALRSVHKSTGKLWLHSTPLCLNSQNQHCLALVVRPQEPHALFQRVVAEQKASKFCSEKTAANACENFPLYPIASTTRERSGNGSLLGSFQTETLLMLSCVDVLVGLSMHLIRESCLYERMEPLSYFAPISITLLHKPHVVKWCCPSDGKHTVRIG